MRLRQIAGVQWREPTSSRIVGNGRGLSEGLDRRRKDFKTQPARSRDSIYAYYQSKVTRIPKSTLHKALARVRSIRVRRRTSAPHADASRNPAEETKIKAIPDWKTLLRGISSKKRRLTHPFPLRRTPSRAAGQVCLGANALSQTCLRLRCPIGYWNTPPRFASLARCPTTLPTASR